MKPKAIKSKFHTTVSFPVAINPRPIIRSKIGIATMKQVFEAMQRKVAISH